MKFKYLEKHAAQWAVYCLAEGEEISESAPVAALHKLTGPDAANGGPWAVEYLGADQVRGAPLPQFPTWEIAEQYLFQRLHCRDAAAPLETAQATA